MQSFISLHSESAVVFSVSGRKVNPSYKTLPPFSCSNNTSYHLALVLTILYVPCHSSPIRADFVRSATEYLRSFSTVKYFQLLPVGVSPSKTRPVPSSQFRPTGGEHPPLSWLSIVPSVPLLYPPLPSISFQSLFAL